MKRHNHNKKKSPLPLQRNCVELDKLEGSSEASQIQNISPHTVFSADTDSFHASSILTHPLFDSLNALLDDSRYPLGNHAAQQTIFLSLIQRGIEEGRELPRLADCIDRALASIAGSTCFLAGWGKPSAFSKSLYDYQQQIKAHTARKKTEKALQHPTHKKTYCALSDGSAASIKPIELDTFDADSKDELDEKTHLLPANPYRVQAIRDSEKKKEDARIARSAMAEKQYAEYQRLSLGYLTRPTGIQDIAKACDHLMNAALQGHTEAIHLLNLSPTDPLTLFNRSLHQERFFIKKLKSISPTELLYAEAQWTLFLLCQGKRYQHVYEDYESRFHDLQQAVTHLEACVEAGSFIYPERLFCATTFLSPKTQEREEQPEETSHRLRCSAWEWLKKEMEGKDPFLDWLLLIKSSSLLKKTRSDLSDRPSKEVASSSSIYPFRVCPAEAIDHFFLTHLDLIHEGSEPIAEKILWATENQPMQRIRVEKNAAGQYIIPLLTDDLIQSQRLGVIIFFDEEKKMEIARLICDPQRLLFYAYDNHSVHLSLSQAIIRDYCQFNHLQGQLTVESQLTNKKMQYTEIRTKECVIQKNSRLHAEKLKIQAENTHNHGTLDGDTLQLHTTQHLTNHATARIHATYQLALTGGSVWNAGIIEAPEKGVVSLNHLFVHGIVSFALLKEAIEKREWPCGAVFAGGDLSITTGGYVNLLSQVKARNWSLMTIAEMNIGFGTAVNTTKSRFIALDCGIDVPHLLQMMNDMIPILNLIGKGEFSEAFSELDKTRTFMKGASFARWILRTFLPAAGKPVDMGWTAVMLLWSLPSIYSQCQALYQKSLRNEAIEPRDIYTLLALAGSLTNQVLFLQTQIQDWGQATPIPFKWQWPKESTSMLMLDILALFAPTQTDDALIKLKSGIHATGSLLDRSLVTCGSAHIALAMNISNLFLYSRQLGTAQVANNVSETGRILSQHSAILANNHFTNVVTQETTNVIAANQLLWQADKMYDQSHLHPSVPAKVRQKST